MISKIGVCIVFIALYNLIIVHGKKMTYIFFGTMEYLLVGCLISSWQNNIEWFISTIIFQIAFIIVVYNYNNSIERNSIFDAFKSNSFVLVLFSGLNKLEREKYAKIKKCVDELFNINISGKVYLFLSYLDDKLIIRYLFVDKKSYELYRNKVQMNRENISEINEEGKGMSMIYTCNV